MEHCKQLLYLKKHTLELQLSVKWKLFIVICEGAMEPTAIGIVLGVFIDIYFRFKTPHTVGVRRMRRGGH